MTMENEPFEDVFPIENGDFPLLCLIAGVYIRFETIFCGNLRSIRRPQHVVVSQSSTRMVML